MREYKSSNAIENAKIIVALVFLFITSSITCGLIIWLDPDLNNIQDLVKPGVGIVFFVGSVIIWLLMVFPFFLFESKQWKVFLLVISIVALGIVTLIALSVDPFHFGSTVGLFVVILIILVTGVALSSFIPIVAEAVFNQISKYSSR